MKSQRQYELAKKLMPGGVSSPVRAVKPYPFFVEAGNEARIQDIEGNEYIDYCLGYGPLILGHRPDPVMKAIKEQLGKGLHFGIPCEAENELAEKIVNNVSSADMVRFVNSG
ncbi:glutamate-1-semialdehyde aminotransferase, partial [candidate division MSBL1 archaeon SCGC-AAA259M10]